MMQTVKTAAYAALFVATLAIPPAGFAFAQGTPNIADANLLSEAFLIPETNLTIDVPLAWDELPDELFGPSMFDGWLGSETADEDMLAVFGGSAPNTSGFGLMLIYKADIYTNPPLEELQIIENGVKLSRVATWVFGAGMAVVRPTRPIEIDGGTGATMSFLSGQEGDHDMMTFTLIRRDEGTIMIIDSAKKDSEEVVILDQMRASLRPQ